MTPAALAPSRPLVPCTLGQLVTYFLRLGTLGFGGPIALAGAMQKDLVEERRWIAREDYVEGLALAQLAPGPLAAQLAIYIGWLRGNVIGAALVGVAFVLPSFLMVVALAALYLRYGALGWLQGAFYGVAAAVIAIIARSAVKLVRLTLAKDRLLWAVFVTVAAVTAWTESEIVWLFLAGGVASLFVRGRTAAPGPGGAASAGGAGAGGTAAAAFLLWPAGLWWGLHGPATAATLGRIAWYFTEAGAFVFGSGLAIVPFLHGGVVERFHWLTDQQFLDAVAVAMITPGPVVITVGFIGYLAAGPAGAVVAAVATFLPCFLFTVVPAPHFRRIAKNPRVKAFVEGVTAAATGAIAGAAVVLGRRAIFDVPTAGIAAATLTLLLATKKVPEPLVIGAAAGVGLVLKGLGG